MKRACIIPAALLVACMTTTKAVQLEPGPARAPIPVDSVRIYRTSASVPAAYVEVAIVTTAGGDDAGMISAMRKKAASIGANGLLLESTKVAEPGSLKVNRIAAPKGSAVAIFVKQP